MYLSIMTRHKMPLFLRLHWPDGLPYGAAADTDDH